MWLSVQGCCCEGAGVRETEKGKLTCCSIRQTAFSRIYHQSITFCSSGPFYLYPLIIPINFALSQFHACDVFRNVDSILSWLYNAIMHNIIQDRAIITQCSQQYSLSSSPFPPTPPAFYFSPLNDLFLRFCGWHLSNSIKHLPKPPQTPFLCQMCRQYPLPFRIPL